MTWVCFGIKWKQISFDFQVKVLQITSATGKKKEKKQTGKISAYVMCKTLIKQSSQSSN